MRREPSDRASRVPADSPFRMLTPILAIPITSHMSRRGRIAACTAAVAAAVLAPGIAEAGYGVQPIGQTVRRHDERDRLHRHARAARVPRLSRRPRLGAVRLGVRLAGDQLVGHAGRIGGGVLQRGRLPALGRARQARVLAEHGADASRPHLLLVARLPAARGGIGDLAEDDQRAVRIPARAGACDPACDDSARDHTSRDSRPATPLPPPRRRRRRGRARRRGTRRRRCRRGTATRASARSSTSGSRTSSTRR